MVTFILPLSRAPFYSYQLPPTRKGHRHRRGVVIAGYLGSFGLVAGGNPYLVQCDVRERFSGYSSLRTTFGSSRDARHAGSQLAITATAVIVAITEPIVTGSV